MYTFDGVATDLIQVDEDGNVKKLPDTQITFENGYELQQQAGRYYTLKFVENVLSKKPTLTDRRNTLRCAGMRCFDRRPPLFLYEEVIHESNRTERN